MAIIKSYNATTLLKSAIVLDLGDVTRQAQHLRQKSQDDAQRIIEEANSQVEALRQTAHDESAKKGYEEGHDTGLREGFEEGLKVGQERAVAAAKDELERIEQTWTDAMNQWESKRQEIERQARRSVVEFAVRFAEKVVHRAIEVDCDVVVDQVSHVLSCVLRPTDITVQICKEDRPVLEKAMPRLLGEMANVKHMNLVEDDSIKRGGCVVSYGQGRIDASIETQLKNLADLFLP